MDQKAIRRIFKQCIKHQPYRLRCKMARRLTELVSSEINLVTTDTRGDKSDFLPAWKFGINPRREIPLSDGLMIQRAIFSNEV